MKRWIVSWSGRAARFAGFLAEQFWQPSSSRRIDAYAMAERTGRGAVAEALGPDAVLAERVSWHLANRARLSNSAAVEAEGCRALLSWTILAAVVARTPDASRILAEVSAAFAVSRADDVQQQEARAFLLRELQMFGSMVELARSPSGQQSSNETAG